VGTLTRSQREERGSGQMAMMHPEMMLGKPDSGETDFLGGLDER